MTVGKSVLVNDATKPVSQSAFHVIREFSLTKANFSTLWSLFWESIPFTFCNQSHIPPVYKFLRLHPPHPSEDDDFFCVIEDLYMSVALSQRKVIHWVN